jgi:uncharacterized membrane protein YbhN (UPF0104 family)
VQSERETLLMRPDPPSTAVPRLALARRIASLAVLIAAMGSLLLAVPSLRGVAARIAHLNGGWVVAGIVLELGSCVGFVVIFRAFFDELPAGVAREVAWVEQGSGALLPGGGIGALAIGGLLLRRAGMSTARIVERSSALFFLTSAVNVAVLVGAATLVAVGASAGPDDPWRTGMPIAGGVVAAAAVLAIPRVVRRPQRPTTLRWLSDLAVGIDGARGALLRPTWRLVGAFTWLAFDIAALGAIFAATGRPLPVATLVLGYMIGYLANLIPVPGGFGVLEGGLAGALIAYGAPVPQAAAAVIAYHAIAFWIPSIGGIAGYALLRRRGREHPERVTERTRPQPAVMVREPVTC